MSSSFRIQPNNQIQVNYVVSPQPRSLTEFIVPMFLSMEWQRRQRNNDLLKEKVQASLVRKRQKIEREITALCPDNEVQFNLNLCSLFPTAPKFCTSSSCKLV